MSKLTRVKVFKNERRREGIRSWFERVHAYDAEFCQWGIDCEELDGGPGSFTAAIVRLDDGSIEMPRADMIQFKEAPE